MGDGGGGDTEKQIVFGCFEGKEKKKKKKKKENTKDCLSAAFEARAEDVDARQGETTQPSSNESKKQINKKKTLISTFFRPTSTPFLSLL